MIITDLKIGIRNILRNKVQSLISIIGLGIGLGSIIRIKLVDIHIRRLFSNPYCNINGELAELASSNKESGRSTAI